MKERQLSKDSRARILSKFERTAYIKTLSYRRDFNKNFNQSSGIFH